jgi:hypothetical protein
MKMRRRKLSMTKRALQFGLSIMMTAVLACAAVAHAQGSRSRNPYPQPIPDRGRDYPSEPKTTGIDVTVEGELIATGGDEGSRSKSDRTIAQYGLKVTRVVGSNSEQLTNLPGSILRYRETSKSKDLIKKHGEGEKLIIKGKLDIEEGVLEVKSFKPAEPSGSDSHGSGAKRLAV